MGPWGLTKTLANTVRRHRAEPECMWESWTSINVRCVGLAVELPLDNLHWTQIAARHKQQALDLTWPQLAEGPANGAATSKQPPPQLPDLPAVANEPAAALGGSQYSNQLVDQWEVRVAPKDTQPQRLADTTQSTTSASPLRAQPHHPKQPPVHVPFVPLTVSGPQPPPGLPPPQNLPVPVPGTAEKRANRRQHQNARPSLSGAGHV